VKHDLLRTLPGQAILIGLLVKATVILLEAATGPAPMFVRAVDTVATLAAAAGGVYFLLRGLAAAKRRLLWRVRRKLIISYIFIGFIPALLIAAFFLLGGLLLFSNFSSYLVLSQLRGFADRAQAMAQSTAIEIQRAGGRDLAAVLARRRELAAREFPSVSLAVLQVDRACDAPADPAGPGAGAAARPVAVAGAWPHAEPPAAVPGWMTCDGFSGVIAYTHEGHTTEVDSTPNVSVNGDDVVAAHLLVRALAFPDTANARYAVILDVPVDGPERERLRRETGVELNTVTVVDSAARPVVGRSGADRVRDDPAPPRLPMSSFAVLDFRDWETGQTGRMVATMQLSIAEIYSRISSAQGMIAGRSFGQGLLLVLVLIGILFLIIAVVALLMGLALARSISGSVHQLFTGTERVRRGDFTHKIAVTAPDQLGELAQSFNSMTASIEDLLREAAEKKRLEEELRIAHEIQMSLLPQGPLVMPGLSVTSLCVPAREVGGDYYDFLPLDDHRVGVLIADVSGKGTSAALYMAELKGLVLSLSRIHSSPRALLIEANRIISAHLDARSFITMIYAVVDLRERSMTYARAGHTPLIYVPGPWNDDAASRHARVLAPDGLVLGLKLDNGEMFERLLQQQTIPLRSGDLYLFFTDGISEAMNAADDCFGEQRLATLVEEHAHLPSDELRERVLREIEAFVGGAGQHDDMTMILLKVQGAGTEALADVPSAVAQGVG
jgi:sigma-B regulation protein RsbU (phosphoserine phosphatase)